MSNLGRALCEQAALSDIMLSTRATAARYTTDGGTPPVNLVTHRLLWRARDLARGATPRVDFREAGAVVAVALAVIAVAHPFVAVVKAAAAVVVGFCGRVVLPSQLQSCRRPGVRESRHPFLRKNSGHLR